MITSCTYLGCPLKSSCKRFTSQPTGDYLTNPSKTVNGKFTCDMYWGEESDYLFQQLTSILSGKQTKNTSRNTKPVKPTSRSGRKDRNN